MYFIWTRFTWTYFGVGGDGRRVFFDGHSLVGNSGGGPRFGFGDAGASKRSCDFCLLGHFPSAGWSRAAREFDDLRSGQRLRQRFGGGVARGIGKRRKRPHLNARIFRERSGDEERILGLDRPFFDAQAAGRNNSVAGKKYANARRNVILQEEKRSAIFFAKITMQIELGAERLDQQLPGGVVDEEGQVQSFVRNFLPFIFLVPSLLPGGGVVEKAGLAGDGRWHRVRTGHHAVDLNQSQGSPANLGGGSAQQRALTGEQAESGKEKIQPAGNRDRRKKHEFVDRDE